MSKASITVRFAKMTDDMQRDALQCLLMALHMHSDENEIAACIAKEFDRKHGGTCHCVVGNFGSHLPSGCNICFYDGSKYIMLFKPG